MSLFFLDTVTITPITVAAPHGVVTEGTQFDSKAYVELNNKLSRTSDGTPITPSQFFMLPGDTNIKKNDMIIIKKLGGIVATGDDVIRREVINVFPVRGMGFSHLEVTTSNAKNGA